MSHRSVTVVVERDADAPIDGPHLQFAKYSMLHANEDNCIQLRILLTVIPLLLDDPF